MTKKKAPSPPKKGAGKGEVKAATPEPKEKKPNIIIAGFRGMGGNIKEHKLRSPVLWLVFIIAAVVVIAALAAPAMGFLQNAGVVTPDYATEHTADYTTTIVPSLDVGTLFKIAPKAHSRTVIEDPGWFDGNTEGIRGYFYDPQGKGSGINVPVLSKITNSSYAKEVVAKMANRDTAGLTNPLQMHCWTNHAPADPKTITGFDAVPVQMKIHVRLTYESMTGEEDTSTTKECTITTTIYHYHAPDPGVVDEGVRQYNQIYESTYVYAPANLHPRYQAIVLYVKGQTFHKVYEDDMLGGAESTKLVSDTGIEWYTADYTIDGEKQPVWYRYPIEYDVPGEGIIGGNLPDLGTRSSADTTEWLYATDTEGVMA